MKNLQFKKALEQRDNDSILRNYNYTLSIPSEKYEESFDLIGLHKIVENKVAKFEDINDKVEFSFSKRFFKNLLFSIEELTSDNLSTDQTLHNEITNSLKQVTKSVIFPDSAASIFLQNLYANYPDYFEGAVSVITDSLNYGQLRKSNYFKGVFLASQFETQTIDALSKMETEAKSILQLRTEFEIENAKIQSDFENLVENSREKSKLEIQNLKGLFDSWNIEYAKQLDELKELASSQMKLGHAKSIEFLKKSLHKKIQLEQAYREQMRFKAPAEYWKERATFLNSEGKTFMHWLVTLVIVGVLMLFSLLWLTPENMLESIFSGEPSKAIRWSIIFITLISLLFVGIQALKKAMFSSYHLARDAEEREKLTVFYLSLIKDSTITQEDRSLILQSLFSRADTGMLKDEGSPTMPSILDKIKN